MKKRTTKIVALLVALVLAVGCAAGCGTSSASGDKKGTSSNDSTFTYAISGDPSETVNVITTADRWGLTTIKMIYSPLYMNNADGINWFLATDYTTDDNLTYTFNLRKDVKWSDGEPFTADDVVFTYEEMEKEENAGWAYSQLVYDQGTVKVTKIDDYTVSFTFPFETPTAIEMLSQIFIMPKHIYEGVTDYEHNDYNMNPVGTGPYKLVGYQAGSYLEFEANENYFKGKPEISKVIFKIIENADTALLALQSGEVDAYQVTPEQAQKLDFDANNLTAYSYTEGRIGYMMINCNRVTDQKVRQAILFALNKDEINKATFLSEDYYLTPYTFLPTNNAYYTDNVEKYEQNVEKSKELLSEAGVSNLSLKLGYTATDATQSKQALLIQEQLGKAGINVELVASDSAALSAQMMDANNEYDMYLGGYIMGIDPDTFSSLFESGAAYNYMYYNNSTINDLFDQGRKETDSTKRAEIYAKLQAEVQNEAAFYPIVSNNKILVVNNRIQGIEDAGLVPVYTFEDTSYLKISK